LKYTTAQAWRDAAMQRKNSVSAIEAGQRRAKAVLHYAQQQVQPNADILADHELYILGKMDMQEYEQYLLFKHSQQAS